MHPYVSGFIAQYSSTLKFALQAKQSAVIALQQTLAASIFN
jgi:hypothetical protein